MKEHWKPLLVYLVLAACAGRGAFILFVSLLGFAWLLMLLAKFLTPPQ